MFLWFLGTSAISVWFVFRDDRFDYRVLALGALLPDIVDIWSGGAWVMHSVLTSIVLLMAVVIILRRGSGARRRWLALPIGTFLHLVFDGAFNNTRLFWWPLGGVSFHGANLPSLDRLPLNIGFEIAGAVMLAWLWRVNRLSESSTRRKFLSTGNLSGGAAGDISTC